MSASGPFILAVVAGSLLAAAGQVFLKLGADGASRFNEFLNVRIASGLLLYGIGTILWILALSRLPLSKVYPFTILTFVIVYGASIVVLGEPLRPQIMAGAALVVGGLVLIAAS